MHADKETKDMNQPWQKCQDTETVGEFQVQNVERLSYQVNFLRLLKDHQDTETDTEMCHEPVYGPPDGLPYGIRPQLG